ncbi:hypothetical protein [Desulfovibrio sp. ZJ369]|uniref:hypothetical protein n=1 Tax=Desulfovibrio sp. ZJ369 TaxID=2709793 RepID=UPI0013EDB73D|nr:hypothetical protein [Desulfovibrio sp. ZJ369]
MTFYESQRWHSGEKRGFRLNVRRVAAAAAFASAEHFQRENALKLRQWLLPHDALTFRSFAASGRASKKLSGIEKIF